MTQMSDHPPNLMVTGILPLPTDTSEVPTEIRKFLEESQKPILYVALGTFFAYSDSRFREVKEALENQDMFNVMWSHKFYDEGKFPVKNEKQMIIKKHMPQRHILNDEKVYVVQSQILIALGFQKLSQTFIESLRSLLASP